MHRGMPGVSILTMPAFTRPPFGAFKLWSFTKALRGDAALGLSSPSPPCLAADDFKLSSFMTALRDEAAAGFSSPSPFCGADDDDDPGLDSGATC